jgi:O-antigen ligase
VLISLVFVLLNFREKSMSKLKIIGFSFIAVNFIFGLILMQSRLIILASLLITGIFLLLNLKNRARWYFAISIALTLFLLFFPELNGRFKTLAPTQQKSELPDSTSSKSELSESTSSKIDTISCMSSSDLRMNALKSSLAIVQKNPIFGVGTGDWKDELVKKYIELKYFCNANEQTAPHNQYLRTTLKHGFLGLLVLITGVFLLFYNAWLTKNHEKLSYSIALIICLVGYDFMDSGASAPFVSFLSTYFYFDQSERI